MKFITYQNYIISFFIMIAILDSPSLLVGYICNEFGINHTYFRYLNLLILSSFCVYNIKDSVFYHTYLTTFYRISIFLLVYFIVINFFDVFIHLQNIFYQYIHLPVLFIILSNKYFDLRIFINSLLAIASLLSFLSIVQYLSIYLNLNIISLNFYEVKSSLVGIGGIYYENIYSEIFRNVGWFSEPTNFAQFLLVPLFISLYRFYYNYSFYNIFVFCTITIAFILTFSVANFFGVIIGFILFFLIRNFSDNKQLTLFKVLINLIFLSFIIYFGYDLFLLTNDYGYQTDNIIGKSTTGNAANRFERFNLIYNFIISYPLGNPVNNSYNFNAGFFGHTLLYGGFPFFIIFIYSLIYLTYKLFQCSISSKYLLIYIGFFSYLIPLIWDIQFFEINFLFIISFYSIFSDRDALNIKII